MEFKLCWSLMAIPCNILCILSFDDVWWSPMKTKILNVITMNYQEFYRVDAAN